MKHSAFNRLINLKYSLSILFICLFFSHTVAQDTPVEVLGYFEPQLAGFSVNSEFLQLWSNKLRIDLQSSLSDRVSFKANYDYITYHGAATYYILDYLPDNIKTALPPGSRDIYTMTFSNRNFLDNAYLKMAFDDYDITVGKQQISPGTGYAWNPTDIFNIKNVLDPTYEQPGVNAVRMDIPFGKNNNLTLLYNPGHNIKDSGKFARLKWKMGHFDFSVIGGERSWSFTDYYTLIKNTELRRISGGDIVGEFAGIGVWAEAAYNSMEISKDYFEGIIGLDYTFENGWYFLSEYYRNGQGKKDYKAYNFNDWMRGFSSEIKALSLDQWFIYTAYPATDLLTVGGSIISSLNDGSMAVVPTVVYNFDDNMDITIFGNFYIGTEGKTYSSLMGNGGLLRARYYF